MQTNLTLIDGIIKIVLILMLIFHLVQGDEPVLENTYHCWKTKYLWQNY